MHEARAERLGESLGKTVILAATWWGPDARPKAAALKPGEVCCSRIPALRRAETKKRPPSGQGHGLYAEVYVSDAFGAVHRANASTAGVAAYLPAVSGFSSRRAGDHGRRSGRPQAALVAILGGASLLQDRRHQPPAGHRRHSSSRRHATPLPRPGRQCRNRPLESDCWTTATR